MPRDLTIADKLRADPVLVSRVVEVAGWQSRGSESFDPEGFVWHHTAGASSGNSPSLNVCIHGRAGLAGPLCNVFLARDGTVYVVAAGRANHAGAGGWAGLAGNSAVYGLEAENDGRQPWTATQLDLAARIASALGTATDKMCMHREWAPRRKPDMHTETGDAMRARVDALRADPSVSCGSAAEAAPVEHPLLALRRAVDAAKRHTLRRGSKGPHVSALQMLIVGKLGGTLTVDGDFGGATENNVRWFQKAAGLTPDGIVGPKTWAAFDR